MVILYYVTGAPFTQARDNLRQQNLYQKSKSHRSRGYKLKISKNGDMQRKISVFVPKIAQI